MTTNLLTASVPLLHRFGRHPLVISAQAVTLLSCATLGALELAGVHTGRPTSEMLAARRTQADHAQAVADTCYRRIEQGDAAGALPDCRQAVGLAPDSARARKNLGLALLRTGKVWEATAVLEKAVDLAPEMDEAHCLLGRAYEGRNAYGGDSHSAKSQYTLAVQANPSHLRAHYRLARAYEASGQPSLAIEEYYAVLRLRPDDRRTYTDLIPLLRNNGRMNEVRELRRQAATRKQP